MSILEFERDMFLSVTNEDSLSIASKGMGIDRLRYQLIKAYCDDGSLVIVIGVDHHEQQFIIQQLIRENVIKLPTIITSESGSANDRNRIYMTGGVIFVTSRILVMDLICHRIPTELITGIIICKAHRIIDDATDAFILRLYRMTNKKGFITALSQSPSLFTGGFGKLERIMRYLFVTKLYLWPRFHATINDTLNERTPPDVIELRLTMTPLMQELQFAIMDLISLCIKELSGTNTSFLYDASDLNCENVITGNFDKMVKNQFDSVWHQLNAKAKRLISDLRFLKVLLLNLIQYDSVTFYGDIKSIRQNVVVSPDTSEWLFWEPSQKLFAISKQRLYNEKGDIEVEVNPKWNAFNEIINEIETETKDIEENCNVNIIVIVENDRTANQLKDLHERGMSVVLKDLREKCDVILEFNKKSNKSNNKPKIITKDDSPITLTQIIKRYDDYDADKSNKYKLDLHFHRWRDKPTHLDMLFVQYNPKYIILYEPDMQCIRQIELYQALKFSPNRVKVYFFMFDKSTEEQRYLKSLYGEKEAFESLIKTKATMVIPSDRDGKAHDHPDLIRGSQMPIVASTRKAGGQSTDGPDIQQKIIIDMREFRSDLPSLIHKRGIDIEPITLEIGDYLLTPETCVERKSVNDLIGSLNNGRLYHQIQNMTRYYRRSLMLIEFDDQKSFNFKGRYWGLRNHSSYGTGKKYDVLTKLVVLTIHFPQLRLIWSPSPYFSAEVFEHLKEDKEQPESSKIIALSDKQLPPEYSTDKYDITAKEFLLCMPGINNTNVYAIMNKVDCIASLIDLSVEEITEIIGNSQNAELLFKALHSNINNLIENAESKNDKRQTKKPKVK